MKREKCVRISYMNPHMSKIIDKLLFLSLVMLKNVVLLFFSFVVHLPTSSLSLLCVPMSCSFLPPKSFITSCPFVPSIVLPPTPSNTYHHYSTINNSNNNSTYTYLISNSINNSIGTEGGWDIYNTGIRLDFGHCVGDCVKYWQA